MFSGTFLFTATDKGQPASDPILRKAPFCAASCRLHRLKRQKGKAYFHHYIIIFNQSKDISNRMFGYIHQKRKDFFKKRSLK